MLSHSQQRTLGLGRPRPRLQVVRLAKERPAQVGVPVGRRERALARGASKAGLVEDANLKQLRYRLRTSRNLGLLRVVRCSSGQPVQPRVGPTRPV